MDEEKEEVDNVEEEVYEVKEEVDNVMDIFQRSLTA